MSRATSSAFRYPGSKGKILNGVRRWFPPQVNYSYMNRGLSCYCEPFIGCGAMAMRVLPDLPRSTRVIFADKDYGIVCLWKAVLNDTRRFCTRLVNFTPSVESFQRCKEMDADHAGDPFEVGFRKFVLHQMSFSGLGAKAGGPIGGRKQSSEYAVDCRFRPERHANAITKQSELLRRYASVEILHGDFVEALALVPTDGFAYLDPPYYLKGGELYVHDLTGADHNRLADTLKGAAYEWVLSYDDHPCVRELYESWADIHTFEMTATIDTKKGAKSRRKNNELVITKRA